MSDREKHTTKDGRNFFVEGDHGGDVCAFDDNGKEIACLTFNIREGDGYKMRDSVEFYSAEVDAGWRRQRVGTVCFEYARRQFYEDDPIAAPSKVDTTKTAGNYLSTDGQGFVSGLRKRGWVLPDPADDPDY